MILLFKKCNNHDRNHLRITPFEYHMKSYMTNEVEIRSNVPLRASYNLFRPIVLKLTLDTSVA